MKAEQVEIFRKMTAQLEALHAEMSGLVKKGADKPINLFKLRLANGILAEANQVLGSNKPALGFDAFDEAAIPTASDVSFVVRLYVECAEKVRQENITKHYDGSWHWNQGNIVTTPPKVSK